MPIARNTSGRKLRAAKWAALALAAWGLQAQTTVDLRTQARNIDFSAAASTRPAKVGTVLPATCIPGEQFFKTDATPGKNLYGCTATNVWTVIAAVATLPSIGQPDQVLGVNSDATAFELKTPGLGLITAAGVLGLDTAVVSFYYTGDGPPSMGCAAGRDLYTDTAARQFYWCPAPGIWAKLLKTGDVGLSDLRDQQIPVARGGTGADLSATGGPGQFVRQTLVGAAFTTGSITGADLPNPGTNSKGGVQSKDCAALGAAYFLQKINTDGSLTCIDATSGTSYAIGPASSTDNHVPQFSGVTGRILKDGLGVVTSLGNPGSNTNLPTESAVRQAISSAGGGDFSGPPSSVSDNLVSFAGTLGKTGQDSGIPAANVLQSTVPLRHVYTVGTGGVAARSLVSLAPDGTVIAASASNGVLGIAETTAGASGAVLVDELGPASCVAEGTIAAGHYLVPGTSDPTRCKDSGETTPSSLSRSTSVVGKATAGASDGIVFTVNLGGPYRFGSQIGSGDLPAPGSDTLGGVARNTGSAGQFVNGIDNNGFLTYAAPSGSGSGTILTVPISGSSCTQGTGCYGVPGSATGITERSWYSPVACTLSDLYVVLSAPLTSGHTVTATIRTGKTTDTALACTVNDTSLPINLQSCKNNTNTVSITAGALVSIRFLSDSTSSSYFPSASFLCR
jgi:hypothetical protein